MEAGEASASVIFPAVMETMPETAVIDAVFPSERLAEMMEEAAPYCLSLTLLITAFVFGEEKSADPDPVTARAAATNRRGVFSETNININMPAAVTVIPKADSV